MFAQKGRMKGMGVTFEMGGGGGGGGNSNLFFVLVVVLAIKF